MGTHQSNQWSARRKALLGALLQFLDQPLLAQCLAFVCAPFGVHQRHGRAGQEKPRALAALVHGKTAYRVIADAAIQRAIRGANQVDKPGFGFRRISHRSVQQNRKSAKLINDWPGMPSNHAMPGYARRFSPAASSRATGLWCPVPDATSATGRNCRGVRRSCRRETQSAPGCR
jgi:hypothetical protein